ncbi:MAG: SDR family oxidoreductase [Flavobacteriales bacterium]|nr:SDR family oxidoreductase [Flavobacteriales bacterium]
MGKNVIVTGASRGIGFELVKQYVQAGHDVIAISRNLSRLEDLKQECLVINASSKVHVISFDLVDGDFQSDLLPFVSKYFDQVDILVNNAGALVLKPFAEISPEELERVYRVNVSSVFRLTQLMLPKFSGDAHILNISSVGGVQGSVKFPGLTAYSSSKAALVGLTECLAEEFKETSMSFNCLALGAVQTEMLEDAFPGYEAPTSAKDMARYILDFSLTGPQFYNGKILTVSKSTP